MLCWSDLTYCQLASVVVIQRSGACIVIAGPCRKITIRSYHYPRSGVNEISGIERIELIINRQDSLLMVACVSDLNAPSSPANVLLDLVARSLFHMSRELFKNCHLLHTW
jgi:hypothetical protein